ncbi:hypothetical protein B9Z55_024947 [Caenorhabditis nigoni]|uniref:Secreted protein n=1 Tax=Caenorhabditis nigoni TaxID=1611254 RepID=A0A2G5SWL8_9PELO|nr:hypothetical protein B9Z55_024947 [Caenorhabditis nigoni]
MRQQSQLARFLCVVLFTMSMEGRVDMKAEDATLYSSSRDHVSPFFRFFSRHLPVKANWFDFCAVSASFRTSDNDHLLV